MISDIRVSLQKRRSVTVQDELEKQKKGLLTSSNPLHNEVKNKDLVRSFHKLVYCSWVGPHD